MKGNISSIVFEEKGVVIILEVEGEQKPIISNGRMFYEFLDNNDISVYDLIDRQVTYKGNSAMFISKRELFKNWSETNS